MRRGGDFKTWELLRRISILADFILSLSLLHLLLTVLVG